MEKIKGVVAKRKTLQDKITDYVKGFGWKEYYTRQSVKRKPHAIGHLKEYLVHIIRDSQLKQKPIVKPFAQMPMKKKIPSLGIGTVDSCAKNEEYANLIYKMELSAEAMRMN